MGRLRQHLFGQARRWSGIALLMLVVLLGVGVLACSAKAPSSDSLLGTVLTSADPAPHFELHNQFGLPIALSAYSGKVVLVTFLYTSCPDICPIVASQLHDTHELLADDASKVAFVAISLDPARDTAERAYAFSEKSRMLHRWDFLVGDEEELSPVWKAYYIDPSVDEPANGHGATEEEASAGQHGGGVDGLRHDIDAQYTITHSTPVYIIDRKGRMRALFTPPLDPEAVAHDIRLLLN